MITIVDYGLGNLGSIQNMLKRIDVASEIVSDPGKLAEAKKIILPGVGAFDSAMEKIEKRGFTPVLNQKALDEKVPFLGICLGMQLLTKSSEEGSMPGLGYIDAETLRFRFESEDMKVPHMGWNIVRVRKSSELVKGMNEEEQRFYFVHSYYVSCNRPEDLLADTPYGTSFASMVQRENIYGAQFHPEKSHRFGMNLLRNFCEIG